ncbi:MAG: MATE family efflux transporter [Blastomonas sp.]
MTTNTGKTPSLRLEIREMLALALPLIVGNLAQAAINTSDVLILGRYDVDALAASALGVNLYFAFGTFAMGLVTAVSPLVAAERGRMMHSVRDVRRTVRQALWVSASICIPIWFVLWHAEAIFLAMGEPANLSHMAGQFIRIAMWGLLPFLVQIVLRYYVSALERPLWGVFITLLGVVVNAAVCWILVFGLFGLPELGLTGAAIANFTANFAMMLGMVAVVSGVRRFRRYRLFGRWWLSDWPRYREIWRLGLPIAITFAFEVAIFSAAAFLMGRISGTSLAAHAIALQIAALAFMVPLGISQAATVRVGVHHGRRDAFGVTQAGWTALGLGLAAALNASTLMVLFDRQLVGLFVDPANPGSAAVFALALDFIMIAAIFQLVDSFQAVGAGVLRGLQDTRWPMLFAAFGYWVVGIGVAIWLAFYRDWQGLGVWTGLASGLAAVAVLMVARWMLRRRLGIGTYGGATG